MKRLFTVLAVVLLTATMWAQNPPQKMSYQAVIRDGDSKLVTTQVGMQISILQGSESGTAVYVETQTPTPNINGLVTIEIGTGTTTDDFSAINWAAGPYFIKTETAVAAPLTTYTIEGTSQLLSVPYALLAKTTTSYTETDPVFLAWDKSTGIIITESQISDLQSYLTNETQNLSNVISINNSANAQIKNVVDPTEAHDAATKAYVDGLKQQIKILEDNLIEAGTYKLADIEGNQYNVVKIGTQVWMKENLKTTMYSNGDLIGTTTPATKDITSESEPKYQWAYDGNESNVATYGRLYTWHAAIDSRNVCPTGWHVSSDAEWATLATYLGGESVAGGKLKETGTSHWADPNTGATNESGFTALPGGYRHFEGMFGNLGYFGNWWSATDDNETGAWSRMTIFNSSLLYRVHDDKVNGFSVQCLRD